uniref:Reverse transcriptase domain-containing protein n=1 Tax=Tanacetum cinerariifolium TaxID=118510 RepID=A0A699I1S5_TANCI|nr:reverse transcriptase domain-containing protein [Tanacetum cinerariifolium]
MRTRFRSRHKIAEPLRIEFHSQEDQFKEDPPVAMMTDNRTMAEMLRAPTEGYAEAIAVPPILAEQFELKHSLINMMTSEQFLVLKRKIRMITFVGAARRWLEKEPPHSITTWEDLVLKFIDEFLPPSRTTSLRNEISNFEQKFGESFHEAWDRYKDLLHSEHPAVTYISISSDDESLDEPPPLNFVPEHVYPEFMPLEDDVLSPEEQPLLVAVSPTADSPGYITKSDPEEDREEEDDVDLKENPTDYPTDRDDDEERKEEFSEDDADDEDEEKDKEEEHLALADSVSPPAYRTTARMSIRAQTPIPFPSETKVAILLAIPTPPPSSLTSYSSPLPQIPSPPLPTSPTKLVIIT